MRLSTQSVLVLAGWFVGSGVLGGTRPIRAHFHSSHAPHGVTGVVLGTVVEAGTARPLSLSMVAAERLHVGRFADRRGEFVLADMPVGVAVFRATQLGYASADSTIIVAAGDTTRVRFELRKLAARLPAPTSVRGCKTPGAPRADADSGWLALFEQVRQNVDRQQLLYRLYPYRGSIRAMQGRQANPKAAIDTNIVRTDTLAHGSGWRYVPGASAVLEKGATPRDSLYGMHAALYELGDSSFLANHCFGYVGQETADGVRRLRIDFTPADSIQGPDVAGSVFLDATNFVIVRTSFVLTNPPPRYRELFKTVTAVSEYNEVVSGVPIESAVSNVAEYSNAAQVNMDQRSYGAVTSRSVWKTAVWGWRLIAIHWVKDRPPSAFTTPPK